MRMVTPQSPRRFTDVTGRSHPPLASAAVEGAAEQAGLGARLLGLVVDWVACLLIVSLFVGFDVWTGGGWVAVAPLLVLFGEHTVLVGLLGTTIGHRVVRVRVVDVTGAGRPGNPVGLPRAALRAALLCLAIPPLIMDADGRGLHDRAARTAVVRA